MPRHNRHDHRLILAVVLDFAKDNSRGVWSVDCGLGGLLANGSAMFWIPLSEVS